MTLMSFLRGLGLGAFAAYLFDPDLGRRRRSILSQKASSACRQAEDAWGKISRDMQHRLEGTVAEFNTLFSSDDASDRVVSERARSKIGRFVAHPRAVEVDVDRGRATLSGPILASEAQGLLHAVSAVRGVNSVVNHLTVHTSADISALQGGRKRHGQRADLLQENWAPATRAVMAGAGLGLMLNCAARRTPLALVLGTAGFFMCSRAVTNAQLGEMLHWQAGAQRSPRTTQRQSQRAQGSERLETQEAAGMPEGVREVRQ